MESAVRNELSTPFSFRQLNVTTFAESVEGMTNVADHEWAPETASFSSARGGRIAKPHVAQPVFGNYNATPLIRKRLDAFESLTVGSGQGPSEKQCSIVARARLHR